MPTLRNMPEPPDASLVMRHNDWLDGRNRQRRLRFVFPVELVALHDVLWFPERGGRIQEADRIEFSKGGPQSPKYLRNNIHDLDLTSCKARRSGEPHRPMCITVFEYPFVV